MYLSVSAIISQLFKVIALGTSAFQITRQNWTKIFWTSRCLFDESKDILTNERWDWVKLKCQKKEKKTCYDLLLMPYWNFLLATCVIRFISIHEEPSEKSWWISFSYGCVRLCTCHKIICLFFKHRGEKTKTKQSKPQKYKSKKYKPKKYRIVSLAFIFVYPRHLVLQSSWKLLHFMRTVTFLLSISSNH